MPQSRGKKVCKLVLAFSSVLFVSLGVGIKWGLFPSLVDSLVASNLELRESNTETWEAWVEPPIPVYMKFTFFEVENPEVVKAGTAKPRVHESGPFAYRETRIKQDIHSIDDTISFGSYISYEFDPSESCGNCSIDSLVHVINPVMVIVADLVMQLEVTLPDPITIPGIPGGIIPGLDDDIPAQDIDRTELLDALLKGLEDRVNCVDGEECDDLFMTATPDSLMFTGTESGVIKALYSSLLSTIKQMLALLSLLDPAVADIAAEEVVDYLLSLVTVPPMIDLKAGTFGFFMGSNATKSWWTMNNGKYDLKKYNQVITFNGMDRLPQNWWDTFGPTPSAHKAGVPGICHDIIGTDGLGYGPPIRKEDDIWLFNDQLCRSIWLTFDEEVDVGGITAYSFKPTPDVFKMTNPNNYCYCPKVEECAVEVPGNDSWDMSECMRWKGDYKCYNGILSLQGCQGAPAIMSTPHFLDGEPKLVEAIDGISPDPIEHVTYLNLEPLTGVPLQAHKRIQVSVPLVPVRYFDSFHDVEENIFPFVWVDEGAEIDDENLKKLKGLLVTPFIVVDVLCYMALVLGILGLIASLYFGWNGLA